MSNLIALQNSSNELGLGTSHIGLGTIGPSVLPFKNQDGTILMNFNTSNNTINLGTISSGVWQGSVIEKAYGGIGNIGVGPANHTLGLDSNLNYTWISNNLDITTTTEISTEITSNLGIGSNQQELTINTSKLNINIDSITPQQDQVLKYNNGNLSWSNSNLGNIDKLWNLMKTVHPGYVLHFKSIQVLHNSIDAGTLIPTFNSTITNYSIDVTNHLTVSILSSLFSFPTETPITSTQINNSSIKDSYVIISPSSNTYTIKNSYTENSQTYNKTYTLNITRNTFTNNNLQELVVNEEASGNIINLNETLGVGTVYTIDIDESIKNIKMTSTVNRTVQRLGIGTISTNIGTELNISKNDDSIIGVGTGFIGIGTTFRNDGITNVNTNIDTGRISDVFLNIKAEDNSNKLYTFKVSQPPRNNADLEEILLERPKSNDTTNVLTDTFNNPSIGTITSIGIGTNYQEMKFEIKKKHLDQVTTIQKITNKDGNITPHTITTFNSSNTHSIPFSNYTLPLSTNIIDTFTIKNISPLGIGTQTYDVECSIERASSTTLSSLIYKKNTEDSGTSIDNFSKLISEPSGIPTSVIIDVIRIGGQQVIFHVSNSIGIGTQHTSNSEDFFSDPNNNNNNSEKTIYLDPEGNTFKIQLQVLAEDNVSNDIYNISINDSTEPTLTTVSLQSDNTDTTKAISDDTITLSFTASETLQANPTVTFSIGDTDNLSPTVTNVSGNDYTATYIVETGQNGLVSYSISSYTDILGNSGNSVTDDSSITVDTVPIDLEIVQVIGITNITTPILEFTSNKVGTLTYTTNNALSLSNNHLTNNSAVSNTSNNTIQFNSINNGNYSGEEITVTDSFGNTTTIQIPEFSIVTNPEYKTIGYSYTSSISTYDTYDIDVYLNNDSGTLKWGWLNVGSIDDYKFYLHNISNTNEYKIIIGSTFVDTGYIAVGSGETYKIKSGNNYLQESNLTQTDLEDNTISMIKNSNKSGFKTITFSISQINFEVKLFSNILIPEFKGDYITNNSTGQLTYTYFLYPDYLRSNDGNYFLIIERSGNLAIHHKNSNTRFWETNTNPNGNGLVIQTDGNLVIYSGGVRQTRISGTHLFLSFTHTPVHFSYSITDRNRKIKISDTGKLQIYGGIGNSLNTLLKEF
tara:strand:- start:8074 stop:11508 length:3435 start_codon:yes stop_codon:yes gene_type:complete